MNNNGLLDQLSTLSGVVSQLFGVFSQLITLVFNTILPGLQTIFSLLLPGGGAA